MKRLLNGVCSDWPVDAMPPLPLGVPGVFETVWWREREPVFWSAHWNRFTAGCAWHHFPPPCSETTLRQAARGLAAANAVTSGVLRFAAYRDGGQIHWVVDAGPPRAHMSKTVFTVNWGPTLPAATPDRAYKHLGRGAWLDAMQRARSAGCDESLLCNPSGDVVEGSISNLFFVMEGMLRTPSLATGPLPGIIRAEVLALARSHGWSVSEGRFSRDDVMRADEVWLTNSLVGIRPVVAIAGTSLPSATPLLRRVREAWSAAHGWDPGATA